MQQQLVYEIPKERFDKYQTFEKVEVDAEVNPSGKGNKCSLIAGCFLILILLISFVVILAVILQTSCQPLKLVFQVQGNETQFLTMDHNLCLFSHQNATNVTISFVKTPIEHYLKYRSKTVDQFFIDDCKIKVSFDKFDLISTNFGVFKICFFNDDCLYYNETIATFLLTTTNFTEFALSVS